MTESDRLSVAVMGAGLIGCYVGGCLAAGGAQVTLIGRPGYLDPIRDYGLRLTDFAGRDLQLSANELMLSTDAATAADADVVMVTVKSDATADAARSLAPHLKPGTPVFSLQNGVDNAAAIAAALPQARAFAGMVPFNVAERGPGHFHQGTGSAIVADADPALDPLADALAAGGLEVRRAADMAGVLWGKLLVNLNNAINALSGVPLAVQLSQRDYRRAWALSLKEGLTVVKAAGIAPASVLPIPIERMPLLMSLPNVLYRRIMARQKTKVDRHARSSMADDLARGRKTEVDHLNGAIVRLAARLGRTAPVNARVVELVRAAEAGAPPLSARDLLTALREARRARS
jgi:2-dehydropantoate 2-reductase